MRSSVTHTQYQDTHKNYFIHIQPVPLLGSPQSLSQLHSTRATAIEMKATALHEACRAADFAAVQAVLTQAPDLVNSQDRGWTALGQAVTSGQVSIVNELLKAGADPDLPCIGVPPLLQAVALLQLPLVELLLASGADPNLASSEGERPLQLATVRRRLDLMEALLCKGADPDLETQNHTTVEIAAALDFTVGIQLLYQYRASPLPTRKRPLLTCTVQPTTLLSSASTRGSCDLDQGIFSVLSAHNALPETEEPTSLSVSTRLSMSRDTTLGEWLHDLSLDAVYEKLLDSGFDSLEELLAEQRSGLRLSEEQLYDIGISQIGQQRILLAGLELEERCPEPLPPTCLRVSCTPLAPSLGKWLASLGLDSYISLFEASGLGHFGQILGLMGTSYRITEDTLAEIGIRKLGHRHRILGSILALAHDTDSVALLFMSGHLRSHPSQPAKCALM